MGLGQYNSLREYCSPHTASSVFLILVFPLRAPELAVYCISVVRCLGGLAIILDNDSNTRDRGGLPPLFSMCLQEPYL